MRREGVATPIVSFLRAAVRDIGLGANRLIWRGRRKQRRVTRSAPKNVETNIRSVESRRSSSKWWQFWKKRKRDSGQKRKRNPSFFQALRRVLSSVLADRALTRRSGHDHGHGHVHDDPMIRESLSSNLRPFAVGPLSTFLDYMLKSNSPDSGFYCLKNYVSRKLYFWLGKGLKSFLFT